MKSRNLVLCSLVSAIICAGAGKAASAMTLPESVRLSVYNSEVFSGLRKVYYYHNRYHRRYSRRYSRRYHRYY
jgi:hypothetical protein